MESVFYVPQFSLLGLVVHGVEIIFHCTNAFLCISYSCRTLCTSSFRITKPMRRVSICMEKEAWQDLMASMICERDGSPTLVPKASGIDYAEVEAIGIAKGSIASTHSGSPSAHWWASAAGESSSSCVSWAPSWLVSWAKRKSLSLGVCRGYCPEMSGKRPKQFEVVETSLGLVRLM